jgi:post-segregation antitoxin (ccd killing protein)
MMIATMKSRAGKTVTFSISVDEETQRILKAEAKRSYGGNVSALVSAIAKEAKRQAALDWLLQQAQPPPMSEAERDALLAEIDGASRARRRRRSAA